MKIISYNNFVERYDPSKDLVVFTSRLATTLPQHGYHYNSHDDDEIEDDNSSEGNTTNTNHENNNQSSIYIIYQ